MKIKHETQAWSKKHGMACVSMKAGGRRSLFACVCCGPCPQNFQDLLI